MGQEINEEHTKIINFGGDYEGIRIKLRENEFDKMSSFKYMGVTISNKRERTMGTEDRIVAANSVFYANRKYKND